jgi:hypothetical protein
MWLLDLILLILLGILGIASWLKGRQPKLGGQLGPLEGISGWIGLVGLVWGIVLLLRWISALGVFGFAPGAMLIALLVALVIISLSLILALPTLRSLFGSNGFTNALADFAGKLGPYKVGLGFACLVLALYTLLTVAGMRLF